MLKKTILLIILISAIYLKPFAQDFLKIYVKENRAKIDCQILETETVQANSLLDIENANSFHALLYKMIGQGMKVTPEDYTLELTKYKNQAGKLLKVVARSKMTAQTTEGKKVALLVWTSNYYLDGEKYNNILIDQAFYMTGMGEEDDFDTGWILLDAQTGQTKAMDVNGIYQSDEDLKNSEQNKIIGEASYKGALLFKK